MTDITSNGFLGAASDKLTTFTIACAKCGSIDTSIECNIGMGSEWTGTYGEIAVVCNDCGNVEEIFQ